MFSPDNLKKLHNLKEAGATNTAFWEFNQAAFDDDGVIPKKYKELIALAVGLTTQCGYCLEVHGQAAREAGASDQELAEVAYIAAAIRAGGAVTHATHLFDE